MAITLNDILDTDSLNQGKTKINANNATITGAVGAANGIAELDGSSRVIGSGAYYTRTLGAATYSSFIRMKATDGKDYYWQILDTGELQLYNGTDSQNVVRFGPLSGDIQDGSGNLLVDYGSNSNGQYARYSSGWQVCSKVLTVNFDSAFGGRLQAGWTYPAAFNAGWEPEVSITPRALSTATTVDRRYWTSNYYSAGNTSAINVGIYSAYTSGFTTGDVGYVSVVAFGKWF